MFEKNDILKNLKAVYFIGIGGIGMSALALLFREYGFTVAGYDKTPSRITDKLQEKGISVHFDDNPDLIPEKILSEIPEYVLTVFTPAIPENHSELNYFKKHGYTILKRAEVLGIISSGKKTAAVAGTHGKTSVSVVIAHIFKYARKNMNAVLGGISKNYDSNLILSTNPRNAEFIVTEADEYDRSFLYLNPHTAVITSVDEDHLDIYRNYEDIKQTFEQFISKINENGNLLIKKNLNLKTSFFKGRIFTYSFNEEADYYPVNIKTGTLKSRFDIITPGKKISDITINIPGKINIENVVAAAAVADIYGIKHTQIKNALETWSGVKRRFEYIVNKPDSVYIDDYAHHPEELSAFIASVKDIFPDKQIVIFFQPHLYSRTRDFANDFAKSLNICDEVFITEIYPAREKPLPGVSSKIIFDKLTCNKKHLIKKEDIPKYVKKRKNTVYLTTGAGDIDRCTNKIKEILLK
ncbi:MAG: UDP-N-acetylmuramate--L-alanine ligase [Chlorobi bacterium]|nr:UDP-N-acetylmuramate--L-alanine ligase [Chlorobiota bacterium]